MSVSLVQGNYVRYIGLSTDAKPLANTNGSGLSVGTEFWEKDTGFLWRWDGSAWWQLPVSDLGLLVPMFQGLSQFSLLQDMSDALNAMKLEMRAVRLGIQDLLDAGTDTPTDMFDRAAALEDADTTTEATF